MSNKHISNTEKLRSIIVDMSTKCDCGHSVFIPPERTRVICSWCGHYIYKDKKEQFKYDLLKALQRG